jgi:hypothetical protein
MKKSLNKMLRSTDVETTIRNGKLIHTPRGAGPVMTLAGRQHMS